MEPETVDVRVRLDSLARTLFDEIATQDSRSSVSDVPLEFLQSNGITLIHHEFENTADNSNLDPPFLFAPCPLELLERYPIDTSLYLEPWLVQSALRYAKFKKHEPIGGRTSFTSSYLDEWSGGGLPRKGLPVEVLTLRELRGLTRVRGDHELYGFLFDNYVGHTYRANILEYDNQKYGGNKPHLVLLGEVPYIAHEGSILYGELALLITAMRNRAYQPYVSEGPDSDDETGKSDDTLVDEGLLFKDERRFPVLIISNVGPQHVRILYACMSGHEIVVRQSQLCSMKKKDENLLNFLSSFILSEPLDEDPVTELARNVSTTSLFGEKNSESSVLRFEDPKDKVGGTGASDLNTERHHADDRLYAMK